MHHSKPVWNSSHRFKAKIHSVRGKQVQKKPICNFIFMSRDRRIQYIVFFILFGNCQYLCWILLYPVCGRLIGRRDFLIILYVENKSVDLFIKYSFSFFMNEAKALSEQSIRFVKWFLEVNDIVNCLMQEWKWNGINI